MGKQTHRVMEIEGGRHGQTNTHVTAGHSGTDIHKQTSKITHERHSSQRHEQKDTQAGTDIKEIISSDKLNNKWLVIYLSDKLPEVILVLCIQIIVLDILYCL